MVEKKKTYENKYKFNKFRYDFIIDGTVFEGEQNCRHQGNFVDSKNKIIKDIK